MTASFAMAVCAHGAETIVKSSMRDAGWRIAFSRPGLVTGKHDSPAAALPDGLFVRTSMHSLDSITGESTTPMIDQVAALIEAAGEPKRFDAIHVFARDRQPIGKFGFEPDRDEITSAIADQIAAKLPRPALKPRFASTEVNTVVRPYATVLDVVLVDPAHWLIGYHRATDVHGTWPGGVQPVTPKFPVISRAYYKASEAVGWSGFDLAEGDTAVEIGSAPGGACGYLLERGLNVIGVDPAEMDPRIAGHPRYRHITARGGDVPRREYQDARWLLVDSNVRPEATLSTVESIVRHRESRIEGALVTLKIGTYDKADVIGRAVDRVESWSDSNTRISDVAVKQLARNRVEVCLAIALDRDTR